jgi:hypothetical protein
MQFVPDDEAVFGGVEGVVCEVLDPGGGVCGREHAEADLEHEHVNERYLGPVIKVRLESKGYDF